MRDRVQRVRGPARVHDTRTRHHTTPTSSHRTPMWANCVPCYLAFDAMRSPSFEFSNPGHLLPRARMWDHNIDVMHDHTVLLQVISPWIIFIFIFISRRMSLDLDSYCTAVAFVFLGGVSRKDSDATRVRQHWRGGMTLHPRT